MFCCVPRGAENEADLSLAADKIVAVQNLNSALEEHRLELQDQLEQLNHDMDSIQQVKHTLACSAGSVVKTFNSMKNFCAADMIIINVKINEFKTKIVIHNVILRRLHCSEKQY